MMGLSNQAVSDPVTGWETINVWQGGQKDSWTESLRLFLKVLKNNESISKVITMLLQIEKYLTILP